MLLIFFARSHSLSLFMLVISIMATSKIWANHKKSDVTIASSVFKSKTIEASFWCLFCGIGYLCVIQVDCHPAIAVRLWIRKSLLNSMTSFRPVSKMEWKLTLNSPKKCLKIHSTQSADTIASNQTTTTKMKEANEEKRNTKIVKNKQSETEYVYTTQE